MRLWPPCDASNSDVDRHMSAVEAQDSIEAALARRSFCMAASGQQLGGNIIIRRGPGKQENGEAHERVRRSEHAGKPTSPASEAAPRLSKAPKALQMHTPESQSSQRPQPQPLRRCSHPAQRALPSAALSGQVPRKTASRAALHGSARLWRLCRTICLAWRQLHFPYVPTRPCRLSGQGSCAHETFRPHRNELVAAFA